MLSFNSKLVRLKGFYTVNGYVGQVKFQFQTGSIKRLYENHNHMIRDPYGTCQVGFYMYHFRDRFAVDQQSRKFSGGSTASVLFNINFSQYVLKKQKARIPKPSPCYPIV